MPRSDLLALTPDDLASLTNRGTVKRAQKELDTGDLTWEIAGGGDGEVVVSWSDGITCRFPAGESVHNALCSSGLQGISRHVVRSVLAYQRAETRHAEVREEQREDGEKTPAALSSSAAAAEAWDPGAITDDELVAHFRKAAVTKARKRFEQGVLVELIRGVKPTARFLDNACTVRFPVPGDLRYATADCAESLLSTWVPLAVWAFRELSPDQLAGLLCIQHAELPTPASVLNDVHVLLDQLCRDGLGGVGGPWPARLSRVEQALRDEGLVWPAELVADLRHQHDLYDQHDARFEPEQLPQMTGELLARLRAVSGGTKTVPQPLIRGTSSDRATEIAGGRMVGVGLGVRPGRRHATVSAYLQDVDSGNVAAVERTFADPDPQSGDLPRSFPDLAATVLARGVSLAGLASSQLLLKTGKRTPSGLLILPRTAGQLSINPQNFQWEQLKPPFAAENVAQLSTRFKSLPPSYLRPRRRTENLHTVAVAAAEEATFDVARQRLTAVLRDTHGGSARLVHPFHDRGREAFDELLNVLTERGDQVRFVCGHVRVSGRTLDVHPVSVIVDDGSRRIGVLPWVSNHPPAAPHGKPVAEQSDAEPPAVAQFLEQLQEGLTDLLLTGAAHGDARRWGELADAGRQIGFIRLAAPMATLAEAFHARSNTLDWDSEEAVHHVQELCLLARIAAEESTGGYIG